MSRIALVLVASLLILGTWPEVVAAQTACNCSNRKVRACSVRLEILQEGRLLKLTPNRRCAFVYFTGYKRGEVLGHGDSTLVEGEYEYVSWGHRIPATQWEFSELHCDECQIVGQAPLKPSEPAIDPRDAADRGECNKAALDLHRGGALADGARASAAIQWLRQYCPGYLETMVKQVAPSMDRRNGAQAQQSFADSLKQSRPRDGSSQDIMGYESNPVGFALSIAGYLVQNGVISQPLNAGTAMPAPSCRVVKTGAQQREEYRSSQRAGCSNRWGPIICPPIYFADKVECR